MEIGSNEIPVWARHFLAAKDLKKIQEAIARAESKTTGEIVPMIVQRSSVTGHLPLVMTLLMLVLLLVFEVPQLDIFVEWNSYWVLFLIAAFCYGVSHLLSQIRFLQRFLLLSGDQAFQVEARAELEFHRLQIQKTEGRTGVLLFISLMERRAVVLADTGISSKLPKDIWAQICQMMIKAIANGQTAEGICTAIQRSGELLTKEFPTQGQNPNELTNQLILKQ